MPLVKALQGRYEVDPVAEMACSQVWEDVLGGASSWFWDGCCDFSVAVEMSVEFGGFLVGIFCCLEDCLDLGEGNDFEVHGMRFGSVIVSS